jgi:5-amino-6-(5-phosphoribosylamino)uracil reductase
MSVDGYIDDTSGCRLLLSNAEDLDRVDGVRAECDALLVGASTVRRDDPGLVVRSERRRLARVAAGRPASPLKVVVTRSGDLGAHLRLWRDGGEKLVYCPDGAVARVRDTLGDLATVVGTGTAVTLPELLADLAGRGVGRLLVEGGTSMHTQFLCAGLADELQLAVAPFFVGQPGAPRLVGPGTFANDVRSRMVLAEVRAVGDVALLRYLPRAAD